MKSLLLLAILLISFSSCKKEKYYCSCKTITYLHYQTSTDEYPMDNLAEQEAYNKCHQNEYDNQDGNKTCSLLKK